MGMRRNADEEDLGLETFRQPPPDEPGLSLDELDREYMELFVIPGPRYVAPYESVFRDRWILPAVLKRGYHPGAG